MSKSRKGFPSPSRRMHDKKLASDASTPMAKVHLTKGGWYWLIAILLFELWLAYAIPSNILSSTPFLEWLVFNMQKHISGFEYFTQQQVPYPEIARLYLAATLLLVIPKILVFYCWINSNKTGIYKHLVISPLTDHKPISATELIIEPMRKSEEYIGQREPRSLFSRIVWSSLLLGLGALCLWMIFDPLASRSGGRLLYGSFAAGGFEMWSGWVVKFLIIIPFYLAVCVCILRDYLIFFKRLLYSRRERNI